MAIFDLQIPTMRTHMADQVADPPQNGNFQFVLIDSYCENSYLADQVADLPPLQW